MPNLAKKSAPSFVTKCLALAASAENKNEDAGVYEKEVIELYRKLEAMNETLNSEGRSTGEEEKQQAAEWLKRIMTAKQIHPAELAERMDDLWSFSLNAH
ncbi:hypothetical protein [Paenibacillus alvei]|uniref:hypothetical protein n=1 Tax=Paenibacillus alvei TaxID=44250 RepID=UPI00227DEA34|nr:hypothetical protein [Paenibacillus alvei]MCY7484055.1 hypothetical protein [Paenibacillus alvei]